MIYGRALNIAVIAPACSCFLMASAQRPPDAVLERMATVYAFAFGGVGITSGTSPGEEDYRIILARPSAEADFQTLLAGGNNQAKCYALVGLRKLDRKRFEEVVASSQLSQRSISVTTMSGCIISGVPMSEIVQQIRAGMYPPPIRRRVQQREIFPQRLPGESWSDYFLRVVAAVVY